jgi:hypothetical protein
MAVFWHFGKLGQELSKILLTVRYIEFLNRIGKKAGQENNFLDEMSELSDERRAGPI